MAELANCTNCDAVYVKKNRIICKTCYEEEEKAYDTVYRFLQQRKNRQATVIDVVEATGVAERIIIKFIKEKRLRTTQFPMLAYGCEKCGGKITTGKICTDCSHELLDALEKHEEETNRRAERERAEKGEVTNVYYTYDKHKTND